MGKRVHRNTGMMKTISLFLAMVAFSASSFAHQIHCAGLDQHKDHRLAMDITERNVRITSSTLQGLVGREFPVTRGIGENYFYDMQSSLGQPTLLRVKSEVVRKITAGGSAEIRGQGPHGIYMHFYCRQIQYPL